MTAKKLINIEPAQTCQYLAKCQNPANQALIWPLPLPNDIKRLRRPPKRWIMMPVCWDHMNAALVQYPLNDGPDKEVMAL